MNSTLCWRVSELSSFQEVPVTQLRSHVVEAHKMQGYKFQCTFCPKRFDTKAHIREHIRYIIIFFLIKKAFILHGLIFFSESIQVHVPFYAGVVESISSAAKLPRSMSDCSTARTSASCTMTSWEMSGIRSSANIPLRMRFNDFKL